MGVGMSVLCAPGDAESMQSALAEQGLASFVMGEVVAGTGKVVYR